MIKAGHEVTDDIGLGLVGTSTLTLGWNSSLYFSHCLFMVIFLSHTHTHKMKAVHFGRDDSTYLPLFLDMPPDIQMLLIKR